MPVPPTFTDFPLNPKVHESIRRCGYQQPTPVQAACIPPALEGKDVIGLAQTGTGKTAAFAIPIIQKLANSADLGALVLAPTRELAAQITAVFEQLGADSGIRVATIVGGVPMDQDMRALTSWPNVLVATPGRLLDHLENNSLSLREVQMLAVDEADRMHDMGFIPQIRRILAVLPHKRQTMMFTATMPPDVEKIARRSMKDPVRVQCGAVAPANRAKQELFEVNEDGKGELLMNILAKSSGRVLVFSRTKRGVDRLATRIGRRFRCARIHGDMEQMDRDRSLENFRSGECRILVATDIAARGLDVSDIEHVINYDFPHHAEDYVHRIGRTARVEASGTATSFITKADRQCVAGVRRLIGDKLPEATRLESYGTPSEHDGHGRRPGGGRGTGEGRSAGRGRSTGGRSGGQRRRGHSEGSGSQSAGNAPAQGASAETASTGGDIHSGGEVQNKTQYAEGIVQGGAEGGDRKPRRRRRGGRGRKGGAAEQSAQPAQAQE